MSGLVPGNAGAVEPTVDAPVRGRRPRRVSARSALVATASTAVAFGLLAAVVVNAPGWEQVERSFLDWDNFVESAPDIVARF